MRPTVHERRSGNEKGKADILALSTKLSFFSQSTDGVVVSALSQSDLNQMRSLTSMLNAGRPLSGSPNPGS